MIDDHIYWWRVTKYNPIHRDAYGAYQIDDEWTSYSDIGSIISEEGYLQTEENYIQAIFSFMNEINAENLYLNALELKSDELKKQNAFEFISAMWVGRRVSKQEIRELAKLTLREAIWCKLGFRKDFSVHFGYDYYMYMGTKDDCGDARFEIEKSGLFVEEYHSYS